MENIEQDFPDAVNNTVQESALDRLLAKSEEERKQLETPKEETGQYNYGAGKNGYPALEMIKRMSEAKEKENAFDIIQSLENEIKKMGEHHSTGSINLNSSSKNQLIKEPIDLESFSFKFGKSELNPEKEEWQLKGIRLQTSPFISDLYKLDQINDPESIPLVLAELINKENKEDLINALHKRMKLEIENEIKAIKIEIEEISKAIKLNSDIFGEVPIIDLSKIDLPEHEESEMHFKTTEIDYEK